MKRRPAEWRASARYGDLHVVGEGAHGIVYRAKELQTGRTVAIKRARSNSERASELVVQEYRRLAMLQHPSLPQFFDCGLAEATGEPWFAMEFLGAGCLSEHSGRSEEATRTAWLIQALEALSFLHAMGLVHGDVKPENLLIASDDESRLKLIDFGFAKERDQSASPLVRVTPRYADPAVLEGAPISPSSDLFSLGASFLELEADCPYAPELRTVLTRLAANDVSARFAGAEAAIKAIELCGFSTESRSKHGDSIQSKLFGRESELARLRERLNRLANREPGEPVVVVNGEPGIGKTRLMREASCGIEFEGVTCWDVSAGELSPGGSDSVTEVALQLKSKFDALSENSPLLVRIQRSDPKHERIWEVLQELSALSPNSTGWFVLAEGAGESRVADSRISLSRLSSAESVELVASLGGLATPEQVEQVAIQTQGHPLFAKAAALALGSEPTELGGEERAERTHALAPDSVRVRLGAQFEAAPAELQAFALKVAVLRGSCSASICETVAGQLPGLEGLTASGLFSLERADNGVRIGFASETLRRILLERMESEVAGGLHERAARAYLDQPDPATVMKASAAVHWGLAGHSQRALDVGMEAVSALQDCGAFGEATQLCRWLRMTVRDVPRESMLGLLELHGDTRLKAGRLLDALSAFEEAQTLPCSELDVARLSRKYAGVLRGLGRIAEAQERLLRALELAGACGDPEEEARICSVLAPVLASSGDLPGARRVLAEGLELAESCGATRLCGDFHNDSGVLASICGNYEEADEHHQRALKLRDACGDQDGIGHSLANLANVAFVCGEPVRAASLHKQSLALAFEQGNAPAIGLALINSAEVDVFLGRHASALVHLEEARHSSAVLEEAILRITADRLRGTIWTQKTEYERARAAFAEARRTAESSQVPAETLAELDFEEAVFLARSGAPASALRLAERGRKHALESGAETAALRLEIVAHSLQRELGEGHSAPIRDLLERSRDIHHPQLLSEALLLAAGEPAEFHDLEFRMMCARELQLLAERMEVPYFLVEAQLVLVDLESEKEALSAEASRAHDALELSKRVGYPELEWRAAAAVARNHGNHGRTERALSWYRTCMRGMRSCMERLDDSDSQTGYISGVRQALVLKEFRCMLTGEAGP